jgi:hypothetical protein
MASGTFPQWSHLIRFRRNDSVYYGDAVFANEQNPQDVVSLAKAGKLRARVIRYDPLSPEAIVTENEVVVEQLLGPLTQHQVPIIRCVGLNYMKHSTSGKSRVLSI